MNILVLSDTHDHIENLRRLVLEVQGEIEAAIFCGDLCAPFMAAELARLNVPIYACLGNVDEDHIAMQQKGGESIHWTSLAEEYGEITLDERKIAFCHYPKLAELLAHEGIFDAVFHGHTHMAQDKKIGETVLVNPGALCGIVKGEYETPSYALYDTATNSVTIERLN
jgi:putative phosphoesterase